MVPKQFHLKIDHDGFVVATQKNGSSFLRVKTNENNI